MPTISTTLTVAAFAAFAAIGAALAIVDIRTHRLPNRLVALAGASGLVLLIGAAVTGGSIHALLRGVLAALVLLIAYLALRMLSAGGVGGGDVKLAAVIGLYLGWLGWGSVVVGTLAGFMLGGVFAAGMLLTRRADRRTAVAFGPWMIAGAWVAIALAVSRR
ncbi:prepilin peptidase [Microbacterium schleiferi]|uniref:Prepilin peptidase n=1 Tax=Microbacterium schleiferi TaxID=69362 RepID=A0A7S8MZG7_9MICO|nr:A24 family peptidase [Microbacterium schleiferi]QPE05568.1 prepilin peptidase [Microbacterium schleiferi]